MNKYNDVFLAAKDYYNQHSSTSHNCDFEKIAKAAGVNVYELDVYLDVLQNMGMINYSMKEDDKYLFLSGYGERTDTLETDEILVRKKDL